jgi:hypothetical protein
MKKYEDGGKVDETTKKLSEAFKQKYTDDTEENESVRDAILDPIKNVAGKIVKGVTKAGDKLKAVSDRAKGKGMGTAGRMQAMQPMKPTKPMKPRKKEEEVEKKSNGGAVHAMPDGTKMKGAKHGMKHGGAVKAKSIDGIAVRGKTRCK